MGLGRLKLNDTIPLSLTLTDGDTGLYPQAELRNADDTPIATVDLAHIGEGVYTNNGQTMPSQSTVRVLYIVYTDAGHTTPDTTHEQAEDVFILDLNSTQSSVDAIASQMATIPTKWEVFGKILDDEIVGRVEEDENLLGHTLKDELVGALSDGETLGQITIDDALHGIVKYTDA